MRRLSKTVAAVVVASVLVGAGTYELLTSSAPASPCASMPADLHHSTASVLSGTPRAASQRTALEGSPSAGPTVQIGATSGPISVVAAENFWGSLASQLGGNQTSVLSILSDPNVDPHEYESNTSDAVAVQNAQLVIVNGAGYDDWALHLIAADNHPGQVVLNVGDLNGVAVGGGIVTGNPHMWYNPVYVNQTVAAVYADLVSIRPSSGPAFQSNYASLNASLAHLYARADEIRGQFDGTEVASTESIFVYLANYTHLDLVSPPEFMQAVAEGNDPPAQTVVEFQCQLESGQVRLLVYNVQTVTPVTSNVESLAGAHNIPTVGVTETIQPPGTTFQDWMLAQYVALQSGLNASLRAP